MGVVKRPTISSAAMEGLLRQGICTEATRQWLVQKPETGDRVREELLAQVYERLEECPSPDKEWQAVPESFDDDDLLAALLGDSATSSFRPWQPDQITFLPP